MKPIKEYNCSQEKLNPKKFFPVILFLFGFAFSFVLLLSASAESQTLKSISGKDTLNPSDRIPEYSYSVDLKPELCFLGDEYFVGLCAEIDSRQSRYISIVFSLSADFAIKKKDNTKNNATEKVTSRVSFMSLGPKFHFNDDKVNGFASIYVGYLKSDSESLLFISPSIGFEYYFEEKLKFEIEFKVRASPDLLSSSAISTALNAGIGFLF